MNWARLSEVKEAQEKMSPEARLYYGVLSYFLKQAIESLDIFARPAAFAEALKVLEMGISAQVEEAEEMAKAEAEGGSNE